MIPRQSTAEEPRPRVRWKHGAIPVIGLIGGIGGGKSSAARMLASRGAAVIDADAVGHELLEDPAIRARVVERFGAGVLEAPQAGDADAPGPRISRRALAGIVFADASALRDLEAVLHPAMRDHFRRTIDRLVGQGRWSCVVLDAAVLLEAGWDELCDRIVYVDAPRTERLRRVQEARRWSEEMFAARERSQWPCERKRRRADRIVTNDGDPKHLEQEVDRLMSWLQGPATAPEGAPAVRPSARPRPGPVAAEPALDSPVTAGRIS